MSDVDSRYSPRRAKANCCRVPSALTVSISALPIDDAVQDATEMFQALANPTRIRIMHALAHDEMSVGDLARALELSMSALSHQLAILRLLRLVATREDGRQTFYRVIDHF